MEKLTNEVNVHQFGMYLQEFKHLYTEDEYYQLQDQWQEEYQQYLIDLRKQREVRNNRLRKVTNIP